MQAEAERLKREEILQSGEDQHSLARENNKITIVLSSTFSTRREDVHEQGIVRQSEDPIE